MGHVDRSLPTPPRRPSLGLAMGFAAVLLVLAAVPVVAKEPMQARLDAPIAMGTPEGTEILVGVTVEVLTDEGLRPVEGSPIYLELTGRDGSTTRAPGTADKIAGHYTMRIEIPGGGARQIEVGVDGTTDLPLMLVGADPFTFGGITPRTAQAARSATAPRAPVAAPAQPTPQVDPAQAPVQAPVAVTPGVPPAAVAAGLLGVAGLIVLAVVGVARGRRRRAVSGRGPGAGADPASTAPRSA